MPLVISNAYISSSEQFCVRIGTCYVKVSNLPELPSFGKFVTQMLISTALYTFSELNLVFTAGSRIAFCYGVLLWKHNLRLEIKASWFESSH